MAKKTVTGNCNICDNYGRLTEDHVPPRGAFNNRTIVAVKKLEDALNILPGKQIKGKPLQGGIKTYCICGKCNNDTGSWYANHFIEWAHRGMEILQRSAFKPVEQATYHIAPLSIIKQIVTMVFSTSHYGFHKAHPELVEFILNKHKKYLSSRYKFYVYFNIEGVHRRFGLIGKADIIGSKSIQLSVEINYPPYGYVMTIDSGCPDERLTDISFFSQYDYDERKDISIQFNLLPTHLALPGDYRTPEEIQRDIIINTLREQESKKSAE